MPQLSDQRILEQLRKIQRANGIQPSDSLEGHYNLTVEMETVVGKNYTYIKTMYELNKHYGWSKFIVVVPSVAIREGVYKSFQITQEHFVAEYGKKIRFFIYNSARLTEIDRFASDSATDKYKAFSDAELKAKTAEFKERLANGETLDDLLPEAFVTVREATDRVLSLCPYRVQLKERSRRPPLDAMNALLSFLYALLANNCTAALESVGLRVHAPRSVGSGVPVTGFNGRTASGVSGSSGADNGEPSRSDEIRLSL